MSEKEGETREGEKRGEMGEGRGKEGKRERGKEGKRERRKEGKRETFARIGQFGMFLLK